MSTKLTLSLSAAVAVLAATSFANAADAVFQPAPVAPIATYEAPAANWEGFYAGGTVGYGFSGKSRVEATDNSISTDGFAGGVFGGWNGQSDSFVYGAEADLGYNGASGANSGVKSKGGVDGSLRARLGVAATDDILVYTTAGVAAARNKVTDTTTSVSDTNTHIGWTAGVGTDVKLTDQVFGRVEYRYTDLGSKSYDNVGKVDVSNHRIGVGLGMKF